MCIYNKSKKNNWKIIWNNYWLMNRIFKLKCRIISVLRFVLCDYIYECICVCFDIEEILLNLEKVNKFLVIDNKYY